MLCGKDDEIFCKRHNDKWGSFGGIYLYCDRIYIQQKSASNTVLSIPLSETPFCESENVSWFLDMQIDMILTLPFHFKYRNWSRGWEKGVFATSNYSCLFLTVWDLVLKSFIVFSSLPWIHKCSHLLLGHNQILLSTDNTETFQRELCNST